MSSMGNVSNVLSQCQEAAAGKLDPEEQNALLSRIRGVFAMVPVPAQKFSNALAARDWNMLEGMLSNYIDVQAVAGGGVNVNATAVARAESRSASFSSVCAELDKVDGLDDESKREIRSLMNDLDGEKDETVAKHAAKKLVDTVIEKGADALPVVAPFVADAIKTALGGL